MDAFRDKQRESIISAATSLDGSPADPDTVAIPSHFQMRIGKRKWESYRSRGRGNGGRKKGAAADEDDEVDDA